MTAPIFDAEVAVASQNTLGEGAFVVWPGSALSGYGET